MELSALQTISNLPLPNRFSHAAVGFQPLLRLPLPRRKTGSDFGFQSHRISSLRSTTKEEASTGTFDDTKLVEKNEQDYESHLYSEELKEGSLFDNPLKLFKFMEDLNIKVEYELVYSYVAFGSGGAVAFWLVAAIVGAIDSIPVLPKALELVGLGYSIWFTSRFLILKKNREEFFARVEELKHRVLGSNDD